MSDGTVRTVRRGWAGLWPWAVLALATVPAVYHFLAFESEPDGEFPAVARQTYSARPPAAYRLAEPGDTIDRVALYAASAAAALAGLGWVLNRRSPRGAGLWPVALGLALAAAWDAATPWPTFDGWHGLNWRAIGDPSTPAPTRLALSLAAAGLALALVMSTALAWRRSRGTLLAGADRTTRSLLGLAVVLVACRLIGWPDVEPFGYWPRWAFVWGLLAFGLALTRLVPPIPQRARRLAVGAGALVATLVLIQGGLWLVWYHRPLSRLKAVVPGKIYISAMPTGRGLEVAQARHGFRTIINLFNEDSPQRSPLLPQELAFAKAHGLNYVANPADPLESDAFLDRTLALAQDPDAWPILVHCHGCMDRTPAWVGIYRFVVEAKPLDAVIREIEAHRGLRPKASVTLLYNRVLEPRAPERYAADPTAALLRQNAHGTVDPFVAELAAARARTAPTAGVSEAEDPAPQVSRSQDPAIRRP